MSLANIAPKTLPKTQADWEQFLGVLQQWAQTITGLSLTSNAETTAGALVVNPAHPPMTVDRYGNNTTPGTTSMTSAFQTAVNVALVSGGRVKYGATAPYLLDAPINCTWAGAGGAPGIVIENVGNVSHNQKSNIIFSHTSIGFDCTGNDTIMFLDPVMGTPVPATTIPTIAILLARNTTKASLINRIIRPKIVGVFSIAPIYNYGSEQFVIENGYLANSNTAAGTATDIYTANNINGVASIVPGLIASGICSTTALDSINMSRLNAGGTATSDCLRLESVSSFHSYGGWSDSALGAANGRALIYVDQTNGPSSLCTFHGLKAEHTGSGIANYGVLFGAAGSVFATTGWSILACRLETATRAIAAVDANTTIDGIVIDHISEQTAKGISIPGLVTGYSELRTGAMLLNIGTVTNSTLTGLPGSWTLGAVTGNTALIQQAPQVVGFGTPTGANIIANYPGGTATLLQTSQSVAQIIAILKAAGTLGN